MPGISSLKYGLLILALAPSASNAAVWQSRELLLQAERSFEQGVKEKKDASLAKKYFAEAAKNYAMLHAQGANNASLYLNWGNAELLADRVPQAILAYRRGLNLAPARRDLVDNLILAQNRMPHPPYASMAAARADNWLSYFSWLFQHARLLFCLGTLVAYSQASLSLIHWLTFRRTWLPGRAVLLLLLAGSCGFLWYREEARLHDELSHPLVVIAQETALQRGNGPSYPAHSNMPMVYPGTEGRRLAQRGDWLQIQLQDGAIGWVPREAVLVDEPTVGQTSLFVFELIDGKALFARIWSP